MPGKLIPTRKYTLPVLNHQKDQDYIDFPVVYNNTVTQEPFYVEHDFTLVSSNMGITTVYKWTGIGWVELADLSNPCVLHSRGFHAITTSGAAYVAVTEHVK